MRFFIKYTYQVCIFPIFPSSRPDKLTAQLTSSGHSSITTSKGATSKCELGGGRGDHSFQTPSDRRGVVDSRLLLMGGGAVRRFHTSSDRGVVDFWPIPYHLLVAPLVIINERPLNRWCHVLIGLQVPWAKSTSVNTQGKLQGQVTEKSHMHQVVALLTKSGQRWSCNWSELVKIDRNWSKKVLGQCSSSDQ